MNVSWRRAAMSVMLVGYAALLFARGIVPALSTVDTDFPNYFTAARLVTDGQSVERLYDDAWFREEVHRYGMGGGVFTPFPPPTALLLVPLSRFEPLTALRIWTTISVLCLIGASLLLARILSWSLLGSTLFVVAAGHAIHTGLRFGQPYILISTLCILGYDLYLRGRGLLAGLCFGVFVPIKYFPVTMAAGLAIGRQWRVLVGALIAVLAVTLLSIAALGWDIHRTFLQGVLGQHLSGDLGLPLSATVQSFDTLYGLLFIFDPRLNPHPLLAAPHLQSLAVVTTKLAIALMVGVSLIKLARRGDGVASAAALGLLSIAGLLLAPGTATYHFVLLWLPVGLLSRCMCRAGARASAVLVLGSYVLIGMLPYGTAARFAGRGGLTVLAYPRLLLLLVMFIAGVHFIWTGVAVSPSAPAPSGR